MGPHESTIHLLDIQPSATSQAAMPISGAVPCLSRNFIGKFPINIYEKFEILALAHLSIDSPITLLCYLITQIYPKNTVFDTHLPFKGLKHNQIKILRMSKT